MNITGSYVLTVLTRRHFAGAIARHLFGSANLELKQLT
jgi:hypothetical protein